MFKAEVRTEAWEQRTLTPAEERKVGGRFSGACPGRARAASASRRPSEPPGASRSDAATATRSAIRGADGITVDRWQLDELGTQLAGPQGRQHREFVRGVLQGMTFGRRVLGDSEGKGFVWATRRALNLARLPVTAELRAFWRQLDRAAFRVVGEEFPNFVGDPARAARTQADGQRALEAGGPVRQRLAGRYIAGMTPGYRIGHGLGGNINGLSRAEVNRWRNGYVAERNRIGVAGFGEFHFVLENSRTSVMQDASRAVARGMAGL